MAFIFVAGILGSLIWAALGFYVTVEKPVIDARVVFKRRDNEKKTQIKDGLMAEE